MAYVMIAKVNPKEQVGITQGEVELKTGEGDRGRKRVPGRRKSMCEKQKTGSLGKLRLLKMTRTNYAMYAGQWLETGLEFTGGTSGRIL